MDTYEQEYNTVVEQDSPFADSPYECVSVEPTPPARKKSSGKKVRNVIIVALLMILCCVVTAIVANVMWEGKLSRMETAMNEKFEAMQQVYEESQTSTQPTVSPDAQLPVTGPMTPSQVYAGNVDAVVAVIAFYNGGTEGGAGSGFIMSSDGYVVTNFHVIEGAEKLQVVPHGKEAVDAEVVGYDSANDIALLKIEGENLPCVKFGSSDKLVVGDMVAAIGNPLGELTASLTVGYVSAKDRIVNTDGTVINMLQTDAAINSGNSGGPRFNMNGEVVGITTAKYSGNSNSGASIEGLGFAIPIDDVVGILSDLKTYGYVTGAYLGIYARDVSASAQSYGLPAGAYVEDVLAGYAAEKGGIRVGDIIVNLGGYDVDSLTTLTRVLRRFKAGETISVTVYRNGNQEYLSVTLDEKPAEEPEQTPDEDSSGVPNFGEAFKDWFDHILPFNPFG